MDCRDELGLEEEVLRAVRKVYDAIHNHGPDSTHHFATMRRHEREWPALWKALKGLDAAHNRTLGGVSPMARKAEREGIR